MLIATAIAAIVGALIARSVLRRPSAATDLQRRLGTTTIALALVAMLAVIVTGRPASGAIVPTVDLATAGDHAVLGGSTVTNTGASVLDGSLGLWPGPVITGFPPGIVLPPATTNTSNAAAQQAQADLTAAYVDAAGRPLDATTTADLTDLRLVGGVYAGPDKGPLGLTGSLVLDGEGDPRSVFVFQTDSTLITDVGSTVTLVNGAQECNVFWQVGSSATLGTGSVFVGNILALTSITVTSDVTVHGRALARNGAVTLDDDTFVAPTCDQDTGTTTTDSTEPGTGSTDPGTGTTLPGGGSTTPGGSTTTSPDGSSSLPSPSSSAPGGGDTTPDDGSTTGGRDRTTRLDGTGDRDRTGPLARTGASTGIVALLAVAIIAAGAVAVRGSRPGRRQA